LYGLSDTTAGPDFVLLLFEDIDLGCGATNGIVDVRAGMIFAWTGASASSKAISHARYFSRRNSILTTSVDQAARIGCCYT
jgi:hypothetical protein